MRGAGRGSLVLGCALACVLVFVTAGAGGAASAAPRSTPPPTGLTLLADDVLSEDGRLHELTLQSGALARPAKARVLLPDGYADPAEAARRYPVLLLLHGAGGDQRSWGQLDVERLTEPHDVIVVMPEGGDIGFYTDWLDGPAWERFHIGELVPWVDASYRTIGTRAGRAVGGLSMGGFGSMTYASRHPDLFSSAASFSGAVNVADLGVVEEVAINALGFGDERRWGPFLTHEATWRGHNPPDLATNLRWTALELTTGTGVPCVGDQVGSSFLEAGVLGMTTGLAARLSLHGVPYALEVRPCGTHEGHYWVDDLGTWLPRVMAAFAHPAPEPAAFDYRSTEPAFDVWGWSFTARRPVTEFLDLLAVSPAGLTAIGSGAVDVVSPPIYEPGATYSLAAAQGGVVTVPVALVPPLATLPAGGAVAEALADADGRLHLTLDLGPAHTVDQYTLGGGLLPEALGLGSYVHSSALSIAWLAPPAPAPESHGATVPPPAPATGRRLPATGAPDRAGLALALATAAVLVRRLARHR